MICLYRHLMSARFNRPSFVRKVGLPDCKLCNHLYTLIKLPQILLCKFETLVVLT